MVAVLHFTLSVQPGGKFSGKQVKGTFIFFRMDQVVQTNGKAVATHAHDVSQQLEERNLDEAKCSLIKAGAGIVKHMQEINKLLERYKAVENYYKTKEENLIAKINNALAQERNAQDQKSSATAKLQLEENELHQHEANLRSARREFEEADRKRRENNAGTITTGVVAGVAVLATIFTLGAAAPVALPVAAGATAGAVAFDRAADRAKDNMHRSEGKIRDTKSKIASTENSIQSLSTSISRLNREIEQYREERRCLHEEKGKIIKVIVFLIDAQVFGKEYTNVMDSCSQRTALVRKIVDKATEKKSYSLFDCRGTERVLSSFDEAWDTFEKMNASGEFYNFKVEFECSKCNCSCNEFPHVSFSQLVCANCSSDV